MGPINNAIKFFFFLMAFSGISIAILSVVACYVDTVTFEIIEKIIMGCGGGLIFGAVGLSICTIYGSCTQPDSGGCCLRKRTVSAPFLAQSLPPETTVEAPNVERLAVITDKSVHSAISAEGASENPKGKYRFCCVS